LEWVADVFDNAIRVPRELSFEIKDLAEIKGMVRPNSETTPLS
jgi:hypothetical protein